MIVIEIPDWARIGKIVKVKDVDCKRGDDPNAWYKEQIISFGYDGVFVQSHYCPVYFYKFSDYGKIIKEAD